MLVRYLKKLLTKANVEFLCATTYTSVLPPQAFHYEQDFTDFVYLHFSLKTKPKNLMQSRTNRLKMRLHESRYSNRV